MHKRTEIRGQLQQLLVEAFPTGHKIVRNRAHNVSTFPTLNILSGGDLLDFDEYTSTSSPYRYNVMIDVVVQSNDHDTSTDNIIEVIQQVLRDNRKNDQWSYAVLIEVSAPELEAGNQTYATTQIIIQFQYEVTS